MLSGKAPIPILSGKLVVPLCLPWFYGWFPKTDKSCESWICAWYSLGCEAPSRNGACYVCEFIKRKSWLIFMKLVPTGGRFRGFPNESGMIEDWGTLKSFELKSAASLSYPSLLFLFSLDISSRTLFWVLYLSICCLSKEFVLLKATLRY